MVAITTVSDVYHTGGGPDSFIAMRFQSGVFYQGDDANGRVRQILVMNGLEEVSRVYKQSGCQSWNAIFRKQYEADSIEIIPELLDVRLESGGEPDDLALIISHDDGDLLQSLLSRIPYRTTVFIPYLQYLLTDRCIPLHPHILERHLLIILRRFHARKIMKNISKSDIVVFLKQEVSKECSIPLADIDVHVAFIDFHMDSLKAVYIMDRLEKFVGEELSPLYFWDHPTIDALATFLTSSPAREV